MVLAYILITTIGKKGPEIAAELTTIPEIDNIHTLYGEYDILARIKTSNMDKLREIMFNKISKIQNINKTTTLIVADQTRESDNVVKRIKNLF